MKQKLKEVAHDGIVKGLYDGKMRIIWYTREGKQRVRVIKNADELEILRKYFPKR